MASFKDGDDLGAGQTNRADSGTELFCSPRDGRPRNNFVFQVTPGLLLGQVNGIQAVGIGPRNFINGVVGQGDNDGVLGIGTNAGVRGRSTTSVGVWGSGGSGSAGFGVLGDSVSNAGVRGRSTTNAGVRGRSTTSVGVWGSGSVGVLGEGDRAEDSLAGRFIGQVLIEGDLAVTGVKGAVVRHSDGSHRLLCAVESPESWFEDFGEAVLTNGKSEVQLDPDFASVIEASNYHVFLTPYGDSNGLYVADRTAKGFLVQEQKAGTSNLTFSYRIVAKRKDVVSRRLQTVRWPTPVAAEALPEPSLAEGPLPEPSTAEGPLPEPSS